MRSRRVPVSLLLLLAVAGAAGAQTGARTSAQSTTPVTLDAVLAAAEGRSLGLLARGLEAARAEKAVTEARSKGLPALGATLTGSWLSDPPEGITVPAGAFGVLMPGAQFPGLAAPVLIPGADIVFVEDAESTYLKAELVLEQLLFSWGKVGAGVEVARLDALSARSDERTALLDLRRDAAKAYFGAVLARDTVAALGRAESLLAEVAADAEAAFEGGSATRQDLLDARARLLRVSSRRVAAEEGLSTALAAIEFHSGLRLRPGDLATDPRAGQPALDEAALLAECLGSSPELEKARLLARQAAWGEKARRGGLAGLPDIFLRAGYSFEGQGLPFAEGWEEKYDSGFTVTLGGRTQLFDSFASRSRLEQAELARRAAEAGAEETERSMALRTRRLVERIRSATASVEEARAALELAREVARNAAAAFANELASRADDRGARSAEAFAELGLAAALAAREEALLELEWLVGRSLGGR